MEEEFITVHLKNNGFPSLCIENPEFRFAASSVPRLREAVSAHLGRQLSPEAFVLAAFDGDVLAQVSERDEKSLLRNGASLFICPVEEDGWDRSGRKRRNNLGEQGMMSTERERREALRLKREAIEQERAKMEDEKREQLKRAEELEREERELQLEEEEEKNHLKRDHEEECADDFVQGDWGYKELQGVPPFEVILTLMREYCKQFGRVAFLYFMARKAGVLYDQSARKDSRRDDDDVVLCDADLTESELQQQDLEGWFRSWWCNDLNTMKKIGIAVSLNLRFAEILSLRRQENYRGNLLPDVDVALDYQFEHAYEDRLVFPTAKNSILVFPSSACHRAGSVVGLDDYIQNFHSAFCKSNPRCLKEDALTSMLKLEPKDGCCRTCGIIVHPDLINCESCANGYNIFENCVFVFCLSCGSSSKLSDSRDGHCNICDDPMPMNPFILVEELKTYRMIAHFIANSLPEDLLRQIDVDRQACVIFTSEDWNKQFDKFYKKFDDWSKFWRSMEVTIPMKDPASQLKLKFKGDVSGITSRSCKVISKKNLVVVDSQDCSNAVASLTRTQAEGNSESDSSDESDDDTRPSQKGFEKLSVFLDYAISLRLANIRHHSTVSTALLNATEHNSVAEELPILTVLRKQSPMALLQMLMEAPLVLKRDQLQGIASLHLAVANFVKVQPDDVAKALKKECLLSLPQTLLETYWITSASHLEMMYLGIVSNVVAEQAKERLIQLFGEFAKTNGVGSLIRMMFRLPFHYHIAPSEMHDFEGISSQIYRLAVALGGSFLLSVNYGKAFGHWFLSCNYALNDHNALATDFFQSEQLLDKLQQQPSDKHLRVTPWDADFCIVVHGKLRDGPGWLVEYCHKSGKRSKKHALSGSILGNYKQLLQEVSKKLMETCVCKEFGKAEGRCLTILANEIAESYGDNRLEIPEVSYFGVQEVPKGRKVVVLSEDVILDQRNGEMISCKNVAFASKFLSDKYRRIFVNESLDVNNLKQNESLTGWVNLWKARHNGIHLAELIVLIAHFAMIVKRGTDKEKFSVVLSGESDSGKTALMEFFSQMIGFNGSVIMDQITPSTAKEQLDRLSCFPVFVNDPKESSRSFEVVRNHIVSVYDSTSSEKKVGSLSSMTVARGYFVVSVNDHADKRERGKNGVLETLLGIETSITNRLLLIPVTSIPPGNVRSAGLESQARPSSVGFLQDILRIAAATEMETQRFGTVHELHSRTARMWPNLLYYMEQVGRCAGLTEPEMRKVDQYVWQEMFPLAKKFQGAGVSFNEMTKEFIRCLRADFFSEFPLCAATFLEENRFGVDLSNPKPFIFRNNSQHMKTDTKFWFRLDEYLKYVLKQHHGLSLGFAKMIAEGDMKTFELFLRDRGILLKNLKESRWDFEQKYKTRDEEPKSSRFDLLNLSPNELEKFTPKDRLPGNISIYLFFVERLLLTFSKMKRLITNWKPASKSRCQLQRQPRKQSSQAATIPQVAIILETQMCLFLLPRRRTLCTPTIAF
jgi:hypothetical protein